MATSNEIAAALLLQTLADHHPSLQAIIRDEMPEPRPLARLIVPFYQAILEELRSDKPATS
jgi:hypothetical protein